MQISLRHYTGDSAGRRALAIIPGNRADVKSKTLVDSLSPESLTIPMVVASCNSAVGQPCKTVGRALIPTTHHHRIAIRVFAQLLWHRPEALLRGHHRFMVLGLKRGCLECSLQTS